MLYVCTLFSSLLGKRLLQLAFWDKKLKENDALRNDTPNPTPNRDESPTGQEQVAKI